MQKRRHSALEALLSTLIGLVVALITQIIVFPWYGIEISLYQDLTLAGLFTVVSVIRSYWVRRLFNKLHVKGIL